MVPRLTAPRTEARKTTISRSETERTAVRELVRAARARGEDLTGPDGLLKSITPTVMETALEEELTEHLGHEKHQVPTAENGNIGNYEHLFGEVDDLVAAVHFAAELPLVDRERLSVFGHGLGGMLSAMAALVETLPAGETASSAGLLGERAFENVDLPFYDSPYERELRWVGPHVEHLRLPHFACVGHDDQEAYAIARALSLRAQRSGTPLRVNAPRDRGLGSRHACEGLYLRRLVQRFALPAQH